TRPQDSHDRDAQFEKQRQRVPFAPAKLRQSPHQTSWAGLGAHHGQRVNVYLPKSLIARADRRAAELGMSRSSFFGLAVTNALSGFLGAGSFRGGLSKPRSTVRKTGRLRTEGASTKKPAP